jgi:hypothetical protein
MEGVKTCFAFQASDFFDTGIQKIFCDMMCLSSGDDYAEK